MSGDTDKAKEQPELVIQVGSNDAEVIVVNLRELGGDSTTEKPIADDPIPRGNG